MRVLADPSNGFEASQVSRSWSFVRISISAGSTPSALASFLIVLHRRGRAWVPSISPIVDRETPAILARSSWLRNFRSRSSRSDGIQLTLDSLAILGQEGLSFQSPPVQAHAYCVITGGLLLDNSRIKY